MAVVVIAADRQTPAAIAHHVANATRYLCEALHHHRFAIPPDPGIATRALQAGQSARYSGQLCEAWATRCPEAWAVTEIREAMHAGWVATDRDLKECTDVVETGGAK